MENVNPLSIVLGVALACGYVVAYFAPTLVAYKRRRVSFVAIAATNVLLGWTLIGWVVALIWALSGHAGTADRRPA